MLQDKSFCFHYMKGIHNISIFNDLNHSLRVEKQPKCLEKDHRLAGIGAQSYIPQQPSSHVLSNHEV